MTDKWDALKKERDALRSTLKRHPAMRRIIKQFEDAGESNDSIEKVVALLAWTYHSARDPGENLVTKDELKQRRALAGRIHSFAREIENDREMKWITQVWLKPPAGRSVWTSAPLDPPRGLSLAALMDQAADYMMEGWPEEVGTIKRTVILNITRTLRPFEVHQVRVRHLNKEVAALASLMLGSPVTPEAVKKLLQREKASRGDKT